MRSGVGSREGHLPRRVWGASARGYWRWWELGACAALIGVERGESCTLGVLLAPRFSAHLESG